MEKRIWMALFGFCNLVTTCVHTNINIIKMSLYIAVMLSVNPSTTCDFKSAGFVESIPAMSFGSKVLLQQKGQDRRR